MRRIREFGTLCNRISVYDAAKEKRSTDGKNKGSALRIHNHLVPAVGQEY